MSTYEKNNEVLVPTTTEITIPAGEKEPLLFACSVCIVLVVVTFAAAAAAPPLALS